MSKIIIYGDEARAKLAKGLDALDSVTRVTHGPGGRNMALQRHGKTEFSNDGITGAKEVNLKDPFEQMGVRVGQDVAQKTNDTAGDGTTTAINLTNAITKEGLKKISLGVNVIGVKNGINLAASMVVDELRKIAKPIKTDEETLQVATVSAESPVLGKIIADVIKKIGNDGVVSVEDSTNSLVEATQEIGLEFDKGYVSPFLVNTKDKQECNLKNPFILVTDKSITSIIDILPIMKIVAMKGRKELLVIADDIGGDALATFIFNMNQGNFSVLAVKAPGFGERKKDYLMDIAAVTGAKFISKDSGISLESLGEEDLGSAEVYSPPPPQPEPPENSS